MISIFLAVKLTHFKLPEIAYQAKFRPDITYSEKKK